MVTRTKTVVSTATKPAKKAAKKVAKISPITKTTAILQESREMKTGAGNDVGGTTLGVVPSQKKYALESPGLTDRIDELRDASIRDGQDKRARRARGEFPKAIMALEKSEPTLKELILTACKPFFSCGGYIGRQPGDAESHPHYQQLGSIVDQYVALHLTALSIKPVITYGTMSLLPSEASKWNHHMSSGLYQPKQPEPHQLWISVSSNRAQTYPHHPATTQEQYQENEAFSQKYTEHQQTLQSLAQAEFIGAINAFNLSYGFPRYPTQVQYLDGGLIITFG